MPGLWWWLWSRGSDRADQRDHDQHHQQADADAVGQVAQPTDAAAHGQELRLVGLVSVAAEVSIGRAVWICIFHRFCCTH